MSRYAELFRAMYQNSIERTCYDSTEPQCVYSSFRILLVDDEPSVVKSLRRVFLDEPCEILTATDARQALQLLEGETVQLVISDHRMPGMSGAEFLFEVKQRWPDIQRIMLTGFADIGAVMKVIEEVGVFKFITKPWNDDDLRLTARLAFKQYQLQLENTRLREVNQRQWAKLKDISTLLHDNREALTNLLQNAELLNEQHLQQVKHEQNENEPFLDALLRLDIISEKKLLQAFQTQLNLPLADLKAEPPTLEMIDFLPLEFCQRGHLLPLKLEGRCLTIAMADPSDMLLREHVELLTGLQLRPLVASRSAIVRCLDKTLDMELSSLPVVESAPKPTARPRIPQLQAGLSAIRQGLNAVENALQSIDRAEPRCPLCGADMDPIT